MVAGATKALVKLEGEGAQQVVKSATKRSGRKAATTAVKKTTKAAIKKTTKAAVTEVAPAVPTKGIEDQIAGGIEKLQNSTFGKQVDPKTGKPLVAPQIWYDIADNWRQGETMNIQPEIDDTDSLLNSGNFEEINNYLDGIRGVVEKRRQGNMQVAARDQALGRTPAQPTPEPPPVHNLTADTEEAWKKEVLVPWIEQNQGQIRENKLFTNQNIGEIILDNQKKRVSTAGIEKYLDDPSGNPQIHDTKYLKLKDSKEGLLDNRAVAADPMNSPEAMNTLKTANEVHKSGIKIKDKYGKEIRGGISSEWLNPESFRAGQMKAANMARQIIRKIRKIPGFEDLDVQQGHPIDLLKSKGVDATAAFGAESGKANRYWNRKQFGGTVMNRGAMEELGQAPGAAEELADAITGTGPRSAQRRAEYRQFGVLTEIWNQALIAKETKGKGMKEAIATLTKHRNAITKGDYSALQSDFKLPGSQVTLDDMLAIQILALKTGDATTAAEKVVAERLAFEWAKANGLADNQNTLEILQKSMKYINTKIDVEDAAAKGAPKKGYRFSGMSPEEIQESVPGRYEKLPSMATGQ